MATSTDVFRQQLNASNYATWYKYQLCREAGRNDLRLLIFQDRKPLIYFRTGSHVDPREFFGGLTQTHAMIPEDYAEVIAAEIEAQRQKRQPNENCFKIYTIGWHECQIPYNWHRPLVAKLLELGMYVCDDGLTDIEHPHMFGHGRDMDGTLFSPKN